MVETTDETNNENNNNEINNDKLIEQEKQPDLILAKKILWAYKTGGFTCAIVEGNRGIGKSSYSLKVFHDIFVNQGWLDDVAWSMALDRILYKVEDIIDFLDKSQKKRQHEVGFIWDDAAVFGSNLTWYTNIKLVHLLQSLMDTVRGSVSGMILTCPNQGQLLKFLRRYDNYIVEITHTEQGGWYRMAKGYVKRTLPSGTQRIYPNYYDFYSCYLPVDVFDRYQMKRKKYNVDNIASLKEVMKKKEEKDQKQKLKELKEELENVEVD